MATYGKNWYVDFFAYDPTIDRLKRKKFMLDKMAVNRLRQEWARVRKALGFPASYQFYSLKDSGIRDLANAEDIVVARDQARHTDIAVTNKYLKHHKTVNEATKHFAGEL